MCPVCIASTAVVVAGAGSTGGILAVCIGKFRKVVRVFKRGPVKLDVRRSSCLLAAMLKLDRPVIASKNGSQEVRLLLIGEGEET
jgi:hypothetical protein